MADAFKACGIEGCKKNAHWKTGAARNMCPMHYNRWKKTGDPHGVTTAKGALMQFLTDHLEYDGDDCVLWPFSSNSHGRGTIGWGGKISPASRVMCILAHGEPEDAQLQAAHSCGNGHLSCVNPNHLRWATHVENQMDRIEHGTTNRGERCGSSKLTQDQVIEIRMMAGQRQQKIIAQEFGVSGSTVGDIIHRRTWWWLDDNLQTGRSPCLVAQNSEGHRRDCRPSRC